MYKEGQRIARKDKAEGHAFRGERYGKPWREDELLRLEELYHRGVAVLEMCHKMERPVAGILAKLALMRLIGFNAADYAYYAMKDSNPEFASVALTDEPETEVVESNTEVQIQGEVEMANNIETVVMIRGINAANKGDDEIFELIRTLEAEAAKLCSIKNQPKKLVNKVEQINSDISALVAYVDTREDSPVAPAVKPLKC